MIYIFLLYSTELFISDEATGTYPKFGGLKGRSQPKQDPPVERDLMLTLEEVYNGCIKKMEISRKVYIMYIELMASLHIVRIRSKTLNAWMIV